MKTIINKSTVATTLMTAIIASSSLQNVIAQEQEWIDVPLSENTFSENSRSYYANDYEIFVAANDALEFKINIDEGDTIVYDWTVDMTSPSQLTSEFHGHTEPEEGQPGTVMFYKIHTDGKGSGRLTSPFDGVHGWYLNNESSEDITVKFKISGFFEEVE